MIYSLHKLIQSKTLITFYLSLITFSSFAQMDKADKLFADYKYAQAIELYKPIADKGNIRAVRKLAECYRKINDYANAETYYALVVADKNAIPKSYLYYGQLLMTNEKYDAAKIWLQKYLDLKSDNDTVIARTLLQSCNAPKNNVTSERKIQFKNLNAVNSTASDFCAVPYENGILFTSARQGKTNGTSGSGYQEVFFAFPNSDSTYSIEPIKGVVNSKNYNSGPACVDTIKQIIYFTKNNFQYGDAITNKKGDVTLKIFSAKKVNDNWKDIKELELNDKEYSCAFPSINREGNMLFFTSDRGGGFGGKDIYYSTLQNGIWSKPKNAGKTINTPGDERYPFIHADGTLYFSSTGYPGFGGMDIFKSVPNKLGEFSKPENLGKPFNGPTDDFGFYLDGTYSNGFFSSDRSGGVGSDDIYQFEFTDIPFELNLYCDGKVSDELKVSIQKNGQVVKEAVYNKKLSIYLDTNASYTFECTKEGFTTERLDIKTTSNKKPVVKSINLMTK